MIRVGTSTPRIRHRPAGGQRLPYNCSVKVLISAGEASGEMYGAQLIEALRRTTARVARAPSPANANESTVSADD
jgi:hypothetical protein